MRIAAFYSDSPFAGWVQTEGFADVLKRMGHEVVSIAIPPVTKVTQELASRVNKPIDDCEMLIVSGPEHLRAWIRAFYKDWDKLKMPKVGWYHESFVREDYSLDYANFEGMFDFHFFPDPSDAEKYKGDFLPLGVDTKIFRPEVFEEDDYKELYPYNPKRDIDVAFIGLMYPKRARFVEELKPHLGEIDIQYRVACQSERGLIPAIGVWDFNGLNIRRSMELLAETYRRIKVFVTFPSLSNVLVAKVLEAMACGCRVVAPEQPVDLRWVHGYRSAYECAQTIRNCLHGKGLLEVDHAAYEAKNHRMELRFEKIFEKVGLCESLSPAPADLSATI